MAKQDIGTTRIYTTKGVINRKHGPAVMELCGTKHWFKNGKRHRDNGPAIIFKDGSLMYYQNGLLHRTDGPAVIHATGLNIKDIKDYAKISECVFNTQAEIV